MCLNNWFRVPKTFPQTPHLFTPGLAGLPGTLPAPPELLFFPAFAGVGFSLTALLRRFFLPGDSGEGGISGASGFSGADSNSGSEFSEGRVLGPNEDKIFSTRWSLS
jgi:hypothetical protein